MQHKSRKEELLFMKQMLEHQLEEYKNNETMPHAYLQEHIKSTSRKLEGVLRELRRMEALAGCVLVKERLTEVYNYNNQKDADRALQYFRTLGWSGHCQRDEITGRGKLTIWREKIHHEDV